MREGRDRTHTWICRMSLAQRILGDRLLKTQGTRYWFASWCRLKVLHSSLILELAYPRLLDASPTSYVRMSTVLLRPLLHWHCCSGPRSLWGHSVCGSGWRKPGSDAVGVVQLKEERLGTIIANMSSKFDDMSVKV